jgi:hypothetical protein
VQVVLDKQNGILSLFRMSGMRSAAFWLAILLSDLMLFFGVVSIVLGMGLAFGHAPFIKVLMTCFVNFIRFFACPAKMFYSYTFYPFVFSYLSLWGRINFRFQFATSVHGLLWRWCNMLLRLNWHQEAAPAAFVLFLVTIPATVLQGYTLSFFFDSAVTYVFSNLVTSAIAELHPYLQSIIKRQILQTVAFFALSRLC